MSDTPRTTPAYAAATYSPRFTIRPLTREYVYGVIDSERDYQDAKWNPQTCTSGGKHSRTEFLVYMRDYIEEALHIASREADEHCDHRVDANIRKIAGLAVACMEQNGCHSR